MKRFTILLGLILFSVFSVSAAEAKIIDFNDLVADTQLDDGTQMNTATTMDFRDNVKKGAGFTDAERNLMQISLFIDHWEVLLASSSRTVMNDRLSMVQAAPVSTEAEKYAGDTAMGVRVRFPEEPYNSWALVKPPFEIPMYYGDDGDQFTNLGVVKNVGVIKYIYANVYGQNFPHTMAIVLKDQNNVEHVYDLGNLQFNGWRTLQWKNPNYIEDVRDREIRKVPLYPNAEPAYKLVGIMYYRAADAIGGDFINYVKDVQMIYDEAQMSRARDFEDEALWGILEERQEERQQREFNRLGELQVLRYLEGQKQADPDAAPTGDNDDTAANGDAQ